MKGGISLGLCNWISSIFQLSKMFIIFQKAYKKLITFTSLIAKWNKSKNLVAIVLRILQISKDSIKKVTVYISSKTYFVYIAPANKLKTQVREISNWSRILCQINQEILKAS